MLWLITLLFITKLPCLEVYSAIGYSCTEMGYKTNQLIFLDIKILPTYVVISFTVQLEETRQS